jgi:hypothetical protein
MRSVFLSALCLLTLIACSGVETIPGDTAPFIASGYTRYAWRSEALSQPAYTKDRLYQADPAIRSAVEERLGELGYQRVDKAEAEFLVDYLAAAGFKDGRLETAASNVTPYPRVNINRLMDGASTDNAYALGNAKETGNIMVVFIDRSTVDLLWQVQISALVQNANNVDTKAVRRAVREGLSVLPGAP